MKQGFPRSKLEMSRIIGCFGNSWEFGKHSTGSCFLDLGDREEPGGQTSIYKKLNRKVSTTVTSIPVVHGTFNGVIFLEWGGMNDQ